MAVVQDTPPLDLTFQSRLQECVRLRRLGRAEEGRRMLAFRNALDLSPSQKRSLASEKFNILYEQGFYRRAETVMRKAIAASSKEL